MKILSTPSTAFLVVGSGPYATALAGVFKADLLQPDGIRSGALPLVSGHPFWAVIVVLSANDSAAFVARLHRALWRRAGMEQVRWLIIAWEEAQADKVLSQDVYGRENGMDVFGKWADRYGVLCRANGLPAMLNRLLDLKPMWRSTWERYDTGQQTLAEIQRRLDTVRANDNRGGRAQLLHNLPELAWDCFCNHSHANRIRTWLARDETCPAWVEEGRRLLEAISRYSPTSKP